MSRFICAFIERMKHGPARGLKCVLKAEQANRRPLINAHAYILLTSIWTEWTWSNVWITYIAAPMNSLFAEKTTRCRLHMDLSSCPCPSLLRTCASVVQFRSKYVSPTSPHCKFLNNLNMIPTFLYCDQVGSCKAITNCKKPEKHENELSIS